MRGSNPVTLTADPSPLGTQTDKLKCLTTKVQTTRTILYLLGNVACNFKKFPTITQDLSRKCIATRGGECVHVPS